MAAVITAVIVFALVSYYVAVVVPRNKANIDAVNKSTLEEFNHQFNNTLKDYASQVDTLFLEKRIRSKARLLAAADTGGSDKSRFLRCLIGDSILGHTNDNIIIRSVTINYLRNEDNAVVIDKTVRFKFNKFINDNFKLQKYPELDEELDSIRSSTPIPKSLLKSRICGAIAFNDWAIYTTDDNRDLLNNNIDKQESDSIKKSPSKLGVLTFGFSEKRFYRKGIFVEGVDQHLMLVGAVNQEQFEAQARRTDVHSSFLEILLVILLFLSIPLIKPLISSKKEKLTQLDLLGTTTCIGILAVVLVCFSFSTYLSNCYKKRLHETAFNLNRDVDSSFSAEFLQYSSLGSLYKVDTILRSPERQVIHTDLDRFISIIQENKNQHVRQNIQNYFSLNKDGDIIKDISKTGDYSIRKNFSERDYYKALQDTSYSDILSAIYSRYDNKYKLVYVRRSHRARQSNDTAFSAKDSTAPGQAKKAGNEQEDRKAALKRDSLIIYAGFAYVPDFTNHVRHLSDEGYMLTNLKGLVFLHSDSTKSLNENISLSSGNSSTLASVFHGQNECAFDITYHGVPCTFYAKRLNYGAVAKSGRRMNNPARKRTVSDYPVYLLSYVNLTFANRLDVYMTVNGLVFSLAYVLGITLLALLYSVFFYLGDIPILSRTHVYWLFPDNSRETEYRLFRLINTAFFLLFIVLLIAGNMHVLYNAILTGVNIVFIGFVLLNQRLFHLREKSRRRKRYLISLLATVIIGGYALPLLLWHLSLPGFGLLLSLAGHFIYLFILKKDTNKEALPPQGTLYSRKSKRPLFISFFSSVLCYHYLLVPSIILLTLFGSEVNKSDDYHYSAGLEQLHRQDTLSCTRSWPDEGLLRTLHLVAPPSADVLKAIPFNSLHHTDDSCLFAEFLNNRENIRATVLLVISLFLALFLIDRLINFYSGRFFFFELSEAYRLGFFKTKNKFANFSVIVPPFNGHDLEMLERHEKFSTGTEEQVPGDGRHAWLKDIPKAIVSNEIKLDLIMMDNIKTHKAAYQKAWDELSSEEKFVMSDFASDHFVNYKNRDVLMSLMERGYIIADPMTGRLRVMNYGFRNFIVYLEENDPESAEALKKEEENSKGTFSKWRLPIIIVAISGLLLIMYLYKDSYNSIVLLGGSVISAMGLLTKFVDGYKK